MNSGSGVWVIQDGQLLSLNVTKGTALPPQLNVEDKQLIILFAQVGHATYSQFLFGIPLFCEV